MESIKHILTSVIRVVAIAVIILFTYTIVGSTVGTIIFISGSILFLTVIIIAISGLIKGKSPLLKTSNRFDFFMVLVDTLALSLILLVTWSSHTVLQEEIGPLSATQKIGLLHNALSSNEKELSSLTQHYPVLETDHITFRYHPDAEKSVEDMINALGAIEQLEEEIYGREIIKEEPLEVIVLKNADDYFEVNRNSHSAEVGQYDSDRKRAMIYQYEIRGMDEELYVFDTFVHEYSHYLLDQFVEQEDIDKQDVPVWFDEGMAELLESRVIPTMRMPEENHFDLSFTELRTHREWNKAKQDLDVYYQAYLAVEYIIGNQGDLSILSDMLLNIEHSEDFIQMFDDVTGLELTSLHHSISSLDQELDQAWHTWSTNGEFQEAEKKYKELLSKSPYHSLVWYHYALMHEENALQILEGHTEAWNHHALMLEENENWESALATRRNLIQVNPSSSNFLHLSYMLIPRDSEEALYMATKAQKTAELEPYGHAAILKEWMEDVTRYHQLLTEDKSIEAYDSIMQSEPVYNQPHLLEELNKLRNAAENLR